MKKQTIIVADNLGNIQTVIEAPEGFEFNKDSIVCMDNKTNTVIPTVAMDADLDEADVENIKRNLKAFKIREPKPGKRIDKKALQVSK